MPSVSAEPHEQPVCSTLGIASSRAERASAIVCSNGSSPTSVSATPIVTSASSLASSRSRSRPASAKRSAWSVNPGGSLGAG